MTVTLFKQNVAETLTFSGIEVTDDGHNLPSVVMMVQSLLPLMFTVVRLPHFRRI